MGGGAENSNLLIRAWSFSGPASTQEPTQGHINRTKDAPSALNTKECLRALGALCQGQSQRQILEQEMLLVSPHLGDHKGFRSSVPGIEDRDQ